MASYGVRIVSDDTLPEDHEWAFVLMTDDSIELWLAYSSASSARVLAEAWAGFRGIQQANIPQQRCPSPMEVVRQVS